jgi:hypothetical protein
MVLGKDRTTQDIQTFIRSGQLSKKLRHDLQNLRIIKEADLECATYHHLRLFIGEDPKWRVLARKHVPATKHNVDILIFKNDLPVIALELKWSKIKIGPKDQRSLKRALQLLGVKKAYWLSTVSTERKPPKFNKTPDDKYVFHRIIVKLGFTGEELQAWKKERRAFMGDMRAGRGRRISRPRPD